MSPNHIECPRCGMQLRHFTDAVMHYRMHEIAKRRFSRN